MNNIQRLYNEVSTYHPFRAMTIINANLLVDSDRMEFRADRLLTAVEQRARSVIAIHRRGELKDTMERATICIDEMTDVRCGGREAEPHRRRAPAGPAHHDGGGEPYYRTHVVTKGKEELRTLDISTGRMMFICGGAFEGLYDQVYYRVISPGSGERLKSTAVRTPTARCGSKSASRSPTSSASRISSPMGWCRSSSPVSTTW